MRDGQPSDHRYEPPRDPFITRTPVYGSPDMSRLSTSHVERLNLDVRMSIRRLTRLCNGFSRKLTHHTAAISLFVAHHNFVRIPGALRVTPAMEAGITDRVWTAEELVERAIAASAEPVARRHTTPVSPHGYRLPSPEIANASSSRGPRRSRSLARGGSRSARCGDRARAAERVGLPAPRDGRRR